MGEPRGELIGMVEQPGIAGFGGLSAVAAARLNYEVISLPYADVASHTLPLGTIWEASERPPKPRLSKASTTLLALALRSHRRRSPKCTAKPPAATARKGWRFRAGLPVRHFAHPLPPGTTRILARRTHVPGLVPDLHFRRLRSHRRYLRTVPQRLPGIQSSRLRKLVVARPCRFPPSVRPDHWGTPALCFPGRRACVAPTESGPDTGMAK